MSNQDLPEKAHKTGFRGPPGVGKATQFKKGQPSANPGGRPKKDLASQLAQEAFESDPVLIRKAIAKRLKAGDSRMFVAASERGYGKLPQALTGEDGGPLMVIVNPKLETDGDD